VGIANLVLNLQLSKNQGIMFLKALKGKNQFWRYFVTLLVVIIASQIIGAIPLMVAIFRDIGFESNISDMNEMLAATSLSQNTLLMLMMLPFAIGLLSLIWMVKVLHERSFSDTTTGASHFRWERFFKGFGLWFLLSALILTVGYLMMPGGLVWNFQPKQFAILVVISLIFIPLQTGFEEVLFRGYLLQGFQLLTKNKWVAVVITGVLFGLLHIANPEIAEYGFGLVMPQYIFFGVLFGFMTVMDNGLELAWGAHAANNIFLSLFVTHEASALQTPAMFRATAIDPVMDLVGLIIAGLIFMGICWVWFKWNFNEPERV